MKNIAFITGGTRGVGYEILKKFTENNIFTIFTGRNIDEVKKIENKFSKEKCSGYELNMANMYSVEKFLNNTRYLKKQPNIIIHNAGYLSTNPIETISHYQRLFSVNTISPILLTQHFLPHIEKGHLFFVSPPYSIDSKVKYLTPYLQSKYAQTTYMKSLSQILSRKEIGVNSIWTKYPLWTDAIEKRKMGEKNQCVHPKIIADILFDIIEKEDPLFFKGNEIIDDDYLKKKEIDIKPYLFSDDVIYLDDLFLSKLKKE